MKKNRLRWLAQLLCFAIFFLFLIGGGTLKSRDLPSEIFLRLSPLGAIATISASKKLISLYLPALGLVVLTLILGRAFCGWVCPLGTMIDLFDWLFRKLRSVTKLYDGRRIKYYLLLFIVLVALLGVEISGWFDPLSIATRTGWVIYNYLGFILVQSAAAVSHIVGTSGLSCSVKHLLGFQIEPYPVQSHTLILLVFLAIVLFGLSLRRYWCRNLCPLGALLALFSSINLFKRKVSESCTDCGKCQRNCRMGCIVSDGKGTLAGECILCMDCQSLCPESAIRFGGGSEESLDFSRRRFVATAVGSVVAIPMLRLNFARTRSKGYPPVIRPPGALEEEEFLQQCVRCAECVVVCPTGALHPALFESGVEGLWSPVLIPRIGYCVRDCTLCGRVCPSGAIRRLSLEGKHATSIGKARFDHNRCIPWSGYKNLRTDAPVWEDINCAVCEEVCPIPTKAIRFKVVLERVAGTEREIRLPYLVEDLCTGCGFCEYACPVKGTPAIVVEGVRGTARVPKGAEPTALGSVFAEFPDWKRTSGPTPYIGKKRLYEYINGGAEPYLTYSFIQVITCKYESKSGRTVVDLWEMESSDDAFGVFSYDRRHAEPATLPDVSAKVGSSYYLWRGRFFIRMYPAKPIPEPEEVERLAEALLRRLPSAPKKPPRLLSFFPEEGKIPGSEVYFHTKFIFDRLGVLERFVKENVLLLGRDTECAVASYEPEARALCVRYPDTIRPRNALSSLIELWRKWGRKISQREGISLSKEEQGFSSLTARGNYLLACFGFTSEQQAFSFIKKMSGSVSE